VTLLRLHPKTALVFVAPLDSDRAGQMLAQIHDARAVWVYRDDEIARPSWLVQHSSFFDQGLDRDPRILLLRYRDLAEDPQAGFLPALQHLQLDVRADRPADPSPLQRLKPSQEPHAHLAM